MLNYKTIEYISIVLTKVHERSDFGKIDGTTSQLWCSSSVCFCGRIPHKNVELDECGKTRKEVENSVFAKSNYLEVKLLFNVL